jgi:hypothetical protein
LWLALGLALGFGLVLWLALRFTEITIEKVEAEKKRG